MLRTLLESTARSPRGRIAVTASAVAHTVLLSVLVMERAEGTAQASEPAHTHIVYFPPNEPEPPLERTDRSPAQTTSPEPFTLPAIAPLLERSVVEIPHVIAQSVPIPPAGRIVGRDSLSSHDRTTGSDVLMERTVDQPVEMLPNQRPPRYPTLLARAGIDGDVVAQFIVDTTGRVERGSIDVQHATHAEFARVVQERLVALRFLPARARGRVVRQLVEQRFTFEFVRR